ncbi:MAG: nucleotidyltransferase family protein [Alistipes sp.]|nr:nucleotidyltransferase family protein [Alistipes sp.]
MKKTSYDMLHLSVCALKEENPDPEHIAQIDYDKLFQMCQFHSLTSLVCTALESAGISNRSFIEAKSKAIRKNILLDAEMKRICNFFEQNRIWHMPLKGSVLKELYPKIGMRQMADIDILYDRSYQDSVLHFMKKSGYTVESIGKCHHDTYIKPPVYNFEMHTSLIGRTADEQFCNYYSDIKKRLIKDAEKNCAYHFTDEDFYVYMTVHEYKHYSGRGTGLRSLLDRFVFCEKKGKYLNWDYIAQQTDILGISEFERQSRELCVKLFNDTKCESLSDSEKDMLEYYLFSGTYGTEKNMVNKRVKKLKEQAGCFSKFRYIWNRIFPSLEFYKKYFPFFYKNRLLLPVGWFFRLVRGVFFKRKAIRSELEHIKNYVYDSI